MCVGIILKNGKHLQSIQEIETHFKVDLEPYKLDWYDKLNRDACTCQIDLEKFLIETKLIDKFEYDYVEYWEIDETEQP